MIEIFEWLGSLGILVSILVYGQHMVMSAAVIGLISNLFLGITAGYLGLNGILFMTITSSCIHLFNIADRIRKTYGTNNVRDAKKGGGITPL